MLLTIYWMMTICCCLYAICAGGLAGRLGAGLVAFKTIAAFFAGLMDQQWGHTAYPVLLVDLLCLAAFLVLAMRSNSHWPLWTTGCALAAVTVHLASIAQLGANPKVYHGLKGLWAVPMQLYMVRGIVLDGRYRRSLRAKAAQARA